MKDGFKVGDVVTYHYPSGRLRFGVITEPDSHAIGDNCWAFWRDASDTDWPDRSTWRSWDDVELHPDPDPIIASFAAHVLLNSTN
jgi:hypothetical protein